MVVRAADSRCGNNKVNAAAPAAEDRVQEMLAGPVDVDQAVAAADLTATLRKETQHLRRRT